MNANARFLAAILPIVALAPLNLATADQGGVAFWQSGQYASEAAVPASPGWSLSSGVYGYGGKADASKAFMIGNSVVLGTKSHSAIFSLQPSYTPATTVLGGTVSLGLGFGGGYNRVSSSAVVASAEGGGVAHRSGSIWGASDLAPLASLSWGHGANNWMTYVTGNIPVGSYNSQRIANIGIGHGAVDAGAAYTYQDAKSGLEFSAVGGLTYNLENFSTNYRNGIDSHLDYAASKSLSANTQLGIVGYLYYQLTGDSGSGAKLGPFESKVAAIGPEFGWQFNVGDQPWSANVRGYYEFWARDRVRGAAGFATFSLPLGVPKK